MEADRKVEALEAYYVPRETGDSQPFYSRKVAHTGALEVLASLL